MTSKYTPTPWVALKDGRVRDDSGETIAAMYGDVRAADENALLFAAAPDLLAACEAWLSGETTWSTTQAYEMAARAVAKARGGEAVTGRKKDTAKRERIAELLRKGTSTEAIMARLGCGKDLVMFVRQELKGEAK